MCENKNKRNRIKQVVSLILVWVVLISSVIANDNEVLATTFKYAQDPLVIVIDPGHGGSDPGAVKNGLVEKDLNLKVAHYLREELLQYPYVKVYMTRSTTNEKPSIYDRVLMAKQLQADALVSIHFNSSDFSYERGAEVLVAGGQYNQERAKEGHDLGDKILNHIAARGFVRERSGNNLDGLFTRLSTDGETYENGATTDYYGIVRWSMKMDVNGIIVEHAYISNKSDAQIVSSDTALRSLAKADALGIAEYFGLVIDPEVVYNGVDYSAVFDKTYYANKYPDLKNLYGYDGKKLLEHFVKNGINEGRVASEEFDINYYKSHYGDLRNLFGNNNSEYVMHYIFSGKKEGRYGNNPAYYNGVDYSAVYDANYYYERYEDVRLAFGKDYRKLIEHFVTSGMNEGRKANEAFNPKYYKENYLDLQSAFGNNNKLYYKHYMQNGKAEGRSGENSAVYNGVDYSLIYDKESYLSYNVDLAKAFKDDERALIKHFVQYGMKEARKANDTFNVIAYKEKYSDLQSVFGDDLKLYYNHYMNYGYNEGRCCN